MRAIPRYAAAMLFLFVGFNITASAASNPNIAQDKPYALHPRPNYQHTKNDPHALTRLTDGQYTDTSISQFWMQPTTVGWAHHTPIDITIDLGAHRSISGMSFSTAMTTGSDVDWPRSIEVLVSVDGRRYHKLGDLVALDKRPRPVGSNVTHRFQIDRLRTHGRYVKFLVAGGGRLNFMFVDEIEVFAGVEAWKIEVSLPGPAIDYPMTLLENPFSLGFKARIEADLVAARNMIGQAGLPDEPRKELLVEAQRIQESLDQLSEQHSSPEFRAVLPLNDIHARIYALYGRVRQVQGRDALTVWHANPWDFLEPTQLPAQPAAPRLEVVAMRGETRAAAINLTNSTEYDIETQLTIEGFSQGTASPRITVREVTWTDTFDRIPVAAALPVAERDGESWKITVAAGMTRQVWFEIAPGDLVAGKHEAQAVFSMPSQAPVSVGLTITMFDLDFPSEPTLGLGGFDYSDQPSSGTSYAVTRENVGAFMTHLRDHHTTIATASTWAMGHGEFNSDGSYKTEPDTAIFDEWTDRWPDARRYLVYNSVHFYQGKIAGTAVGEPLFEKKVGEWARFWTAHARLRGIEPERLCFFLVDEPHRRDDDEMFIAWARAIKAAEPNVVIWVDPTHEDPAQALAEVWALADVICPLRSQLLRQGKAFEKFYRDLKKSGKRLEIYTISTLLSDPYSAERLTAWTCFDLGAESEHFWAFGDTGGGAWSSWNPYAANRMSFSPLFLCNRTVTTGKHMEAIREGLQDYEYLAMLRARVEELTKAGAAHPSLAQARGLLNTAPRRVLSASRASEQDWSVSKDRSVADTVRVEIGQMIEMLR